MTVLSPLRALVAAGCLVPFAGAQTTSTSTLRLNEVLLTQAGDDTAEFIELSGVPGTRLDHHYVIVLEGDAPEAGQVDQLWSLHGHIISDQGTFVIGGPNVATANMLLSDAARDAGQHGWDMLEPGTQTMFLAHIPGIGTARSIVEMIDKNLDPDGDGLTILSLHPRIELLDSIALWDGDAQDRTFEFARLLGPVAGRAPAGVQRSGAGAQLWCDDRFLGPLDLGTPGLPNPMTGCTGTTVLAGAPPGYYSSINDTTSALLRATLHNVIDDHTRLPYTSGSTDTWDVLELAQENPASSSQIIDVYYNAAFPKGSGSYNREHTWPKSFGFPNDSTSNYPYTDCHLLRICDGGYNSSRSNKPYRNCNPGCDEEPTFLGGSGTFPGNSNWTSGNFDTGTWQVWAGKKGDVARGLLYADVRYEGGNHGGTGHSEPNLILTDSQSLISNSQTGSNISTAYMGLRSVLLQWHLDDPVDDFERDRNDMVYAFQGNRNPFVDHPEWVDCVFHGACVVAEAVNYCDPSQLNSISASATMDHFGSLTVADDDLTLVAFNMPPNKFGFFMCSLTQGLVLNPGGSEGHLCLGGQIGRFFNQIQSTGLFGTFQIPIDLGALPVTPTAMVLPGQTWNFQAWYRDNIPAATSNFTDGYSITFD